MKKALSLVLGILVLTTFTAAQDSSNIELDLKKTEPLPLQSSEYGTVWVEATNTGNAKASNVKVSFNENYPFEVVRGNTNNWSLGTLAPGEEYQIRLDVRVDENAVQGNNTMKFTIKNSDLTYTQGLPVEVRADNNILSVKDVNFTDYMAPGETREMKITLENMADAQLKNIQAKFDIADDTPVIVSGSSNRNIREIDPGNTVEITYRLSADEAADNGVYRLPFELSYENEAGTEFERETTIGTVIGGLPQLETDLNSENRLSQGITDTVTVRIVNRGEGRARFTQIVVKDGDGYNLLSPETTYIGNMDPDDFQTAEYQINVEGDAETISMPVDIQYKTEDGLRTETQTIEADVYSQQELRQLGLRSGNRLLPVGIAAVIILAGIWYWRRRRKRS